MQTISPHKQSSKQIKSSGLTIVELVVAILVAGVILAATIGFIISLTNQQAVTSIRSAMTSSLTTATNRISQDIKTSRSVLSQNAIADTAAPSSPGHWQSDASELVLAATARKTDGESLDGTYPGETDNIVYYLRDGSLYRRLLAFDDSLGNNRFTTIICTPETGGGCAGDTRILEDVSAFAITYYQEDGTEATQADQVRSIAVAIEVSVEQSGRTISATSNFTSALFRT